MGDWTLPANSGFARSCLVGWMLSQPSGRRRAFLNSLDQDALRLMSGEWSGWANAAQRPPDGAWLTWLFLGGRGAGKTRAGAEWIGGLANAGKVQLALVGPTLHDVREVMIEGPSGLKTIAPEWRRPVYETSRRRLVWPNGSVAYAFSAEDPESLRGPQFHAAWADEFCAWKRPAEVLSMLRLGLRLGQDPRLMVTTTPKPIAALTALMKEDSTATTHAPTKANRRNLAGNFLSALRALYGRTRLERQELDGEVLSETDALWTASQIADCRVLAPERFEKVVVGLDPTASDRGDACGIVVVGLFNGRAYVLDDRTVKGRNARGWAEAVRDAVAVHEADWVVAETNQGGHMVEGLLSLTRCGARVRSVKASRSKRMRAEPVAALYEQGRVLHCGRLDALEEEMLAFGGDGAGSPDRVDAMVWAVTDLLLTKRGGQPRIRSL